MTDPARREALRIRSQTLLMRLTGAVGGGACFAIAALFALDAGEPTLKRVALTVLFGGVGARLLVIGLRRGAPEPPDVPPHDPAESERSPTATEWTLWTVRSLGYGTILSRLAQEIVERGLRLRLEDLPSPPLLSPARALLLTCVGIVAAAQATYLLAPRSPADRRTLLRFHGHDDEPCFSLLALLAIGVAGIAIFIRG